MTLIVLALSSMASPAAADDATKDSCLKAFTATQSLRDAGKLIEAREQALVCSQEQCPDVIKGKCKTWQREVAESTPSIVVRITDESGKDAVDAALFVDGKLVKKQLDGLPVTLDPGARVVRVERPGHEPEEQQIVLLVGERERKVAFDFAAQPGPKPPTPETPDEPGTGASVHALTYIGFGLAGAGVIAGAITGGLSLSKTSELEEACPSMQCTPDAEALHDEATLLSHTSTASFAVAGAGAVLGVIGLFALSDFGGEEQALQPLLGPGMIGVRGRF